MLLSQQIQTALGWFLQPFQTGGCCDLGDEQSTQGNFSLEQIRANSLGCVSAPDAHSAKLTAQAGAHRSLSAAQLKGLTIQRVKFLWVHSSASQGALPGEMKIHTDHPHTSISVLPCILLSSNLRLAGAGKAQAGRGLFGLQSTQHSSAFHSPSILLKLFYFPRRIILFRQRLHCQVRQWFKEAL